MEYEVLFHVSFSPIKQFYPRIPEGRVQGEDEVTPRICFSTNLNCAISSMPCGGAALRGMLKMGKRVVPILHLYSVLTWENPNVRFVKPEDVQEVFGVPDAINCQEWWALDTPIINHAIIKIQDADFVDSIDPYGNKGVLVRNIKRDIIKSIPKRAPEKVFNQAVVKKVGLRRTLAQFDEWKTA